MDPELLLVTVLGWFITVVCFILIYYSLFKFEERSMKYYENSLRYLHSIDEKLSPAEHPSIKAIHEASQLIIATSKKIAEIRKELGV